MSLRKSNTAKGNGDCPKKDKRLSVTDSLSVLCFLNLAQCFAKLVRTRSRSITTSDTFELLYDCFYLHSLYQRTDTLKVSVAASPKEKFGNDTIFHFQFNMAATSSLRLVSQFLNHYSSAGFMLV